MSLSPSRRPPTCSRPVCGSAPRPAPRPVPARASGTPNRRSPAPPASGTGGGSHERSGALLPAMGRSRRHLGTARRSAGHAPRQPDLDERRGVRQQHGPRVGHGPGDGTRRCERARTTTGHPHRPGARHPLLRVELSRARRVRRAGAALAVHTGLGRRRPAAPVAVPRRRPGRARRADRPARHRPAAGAADRTAGATRDRAARPGRLVGVGARPGRAHGRLGAHRGPRWRPRAQPVTPHVRPAARPADRLHRVRRADVRGRSTIRAGRRPS